MRLKKGIVLGLNMFFPSACSARGGRPPENHRRCTKAPSPKQRNMVSCSVCEALASSASSLLNWMFELPLNCSVAHFFETLYFQQSTGNANELSAPLLSLPRRKSSSSVSDSSSFETVPVRTSRMPAVSDMQTATFNETRNEHATPHALDAICYECRCKLRRGDAIQFMMDRRFCSQRCRYIHYVTSFGTQTENYTADYVHAQPV